MKLKFYCFALALTVSCKQRVSDFSSAGAQKITCQGNKLVVEADGSFFCQTVAEKNFEIGTTITKEFERRKNCPDGSSVSGGVLYPDGSAYEKAQIVICTTIVSQQKPNVKKLPSCGEDQAIVVPSEISPVAIHTSTKFPYRTTTYEILCACDGGRRITTAQSSQDMPEIIIGARCGLEPKLHDKANDP